MSFRKASIFKTLTTLCRYGRNERKSSTSTTESSLFTELSPAVDDTEDKVTIIGAGQVGVACAFTILSQGISRSIVLVDKNENKLKGETLDLKHGSLFLKTSKVEASTNFNKTANSKICILTAGVRRRSLNESRFGLAEKNMVIFREIIPEIIKYSPKTIILVVTNPVDIMTCFAWKLSGFPLSRIIGSGTNVDSARFRHMISERFQLPASSCRSYIIGEHDKNLIALWSAVNIGGVQIRDMSPKAALDGDKEGWKSLEQSVFIISEELIHLKGHGCWATAMSVGQIVDKILSNTHGIATVSTNVNGYHGVDFDVFHSLPCVLNANGIHKVVKQPLEKDEKDMFLRSAKAHKEFMEKLKIHE